jgi:hypothetical protein
MTNKPKYAGLGIALGAVAGVLAGNMGMWLAIGVAIGVAIGASVRRKKTGCPECEAMHRIHEMKRQV